MRYFELDDPQGRGARTGRPGRNRTDHQTLRLTVASRRPAAAGACRRRKTDAEALNRVVPDDPVK